MSRIIRHALRAGQKILPKADDGVVVLCYHLVGAGTSSPVDLDIDVFRAQMRELADEGIVVSLEEAVAALHSGASDRRIVLTFDDAYANFADVVRPILSDFALPATLCVPVGFLEGTSPAPIAGTDLPPVSWNALRDLVESGGLTICAHSWTHPDLRKISPEQDDLELRRAREVLEDRLATSVRSFCYPRARWTPSVEERVRKHYDVALIGGGGRLRAKQWNPLRMERISLRRDMPTHLGEMLRAYVWWEERIADQVRLRFR